MAIEKTISNTNIEVIGQYKILFLDQTVTYSDDGEIVGEQHNRTSYTPDSTISELPTELQDIANLVWTSDIISAYTASLSEE